MTKRATYRGKELADMNRAELIATIRSMEAFHNSAEDHIGQCADMMAEANDATKQAINRLEVVNLQLVGVRKHMDWMRQRHARRMWVMWAVAVSSTIIALGSVLYG